MSESGTIAWAVEELKREKANGAVNRFTILNSINVNDKTEKKNDLTYLSWAWAWSAFKQLFPMSIYTVYEDANGLNYFSDGKTCWVKTGVTLIDDDFTEELIEYLPVMDFRNKSIPREGVTSFDVNKAIQRSLTKAIARHGLGLYIYAGEDLPEENEEEKNRRIEAEKAKAEELKSTVENVDKMAKTIAGPMTAEERNNFFETVIVPTIGQKNYKTCTDLEKLKTLLVKLNSLNN